HMHTVFILLATPRSTLFPYTTLFRSEEAVVQQVTWTGGSVPTGEDSLFQFLAQPSGSKTYTFTVKQTYSDGTVVDWNGSESSERSEEHTSELQSLRHLVCRLLLEKKK